MSANQLAIIKNELIAQILGVSDEAKILELKMSIDEVINSDLPFQEVKEESISYLLEREKTIYNKNIPEEFKKYATPFKKKLDIEQLVVEQNYTGLDKTKMNKLVKQMNIQEPLEDLLKMLD